MLTFDWDVANIKHIARHGVTPAQIEQVFANDPVEKSRHNVNGEERFVVEGTDDGGRLILLPQKQTWCNELREGACGFSWCQSRKRSTR